MSATKNLDPTTEEFVLAISLLVRRLRADAPPELRDFSMTQKAVLTRLEKDGAATTSELARAEGVKPQSMSAAIASLEQLELVERKAHPTDGRQVNVKLSAKGAALRKRTKEAKETWISQTIAKLEKQDQATLFKAAEIIKRMVEL